MDFKNHIIYLMGFPGVGKLTIAREITSLIDARLVDNHLINNPVFSLVRQDGIKPLPTESWAYTSKIRDIVFDVILQLAPIESNFVLTNALIDKDLEDDLIYKKVLNLAVQKGSVFLPVRLICHEDELVKRVASEARHKNHKTVSIERAKKLSRENDVYRPDHPNMITLDVTKLSARDAALAILNTASAI